MFRKACIFVGALLLVFALINFIWVITIFMDDPIRYVIRLGGLVSNLVQLLQAFALSLLCFFAAQEIQRR